MELESLAANMDDCNVDFPKPPIAHHPENELQRVLAALSHFANCFLAFRSRFLFDVVVFAAHLDLKLDKLSDRLC